VINYLHKALFRPERGWDPVSEAYAREYADHEWRGVNQSVLDTLAERVGGFEGKRVLDLGGGPGQYSVAFAQLGAHVRWYDVSGHYRTIAGSKAREAGVEVEFSQGYLDDAGSLGEVFDLVFCRLCWYYCADDRRFARTLYSLVKPGGAGYIECNTTTFSRGDGGRFRNMQEMLNRIFWVKIGHPYPPQGRIAGLINGFPIRRLTVEYPSPDLDKVYFVRA